MSYALLQCCTLVAMFPEPFPKPERGTTLMKDFYTKLFPERSRSRSRSGTRNMERGTWPRSTFPASMLLIT